jgi:glutamine transport system substrate-binding protein
MESSFRVGVSVFPPLVIEKEGNYDGFEVDLWKAIAKEIGITYEFKKYEFAELIPALENKEIEVALAGMTITPERDQTVDFSDPTLDSGLVILVDKRANQLSFTESLKNLFRTGSQKPKGKINSLKDLAGKKVATQAGTTSVKFLEKNSVSITAVPRIEQAYELLKKLEIDAIVFDAPVISNFLQDANPYEYKFETVGELMDHQQYGIVMQSGSPIEAEINRILKDMRTTGHYDVLYRKWFGEKKIINK